MRDLGRAFRFTFQPTRHTQDAWSWWNLIVPFVPAAVVAVGTGFISTISKSAITLGIALAVTVALLALNAARRLSLELRRHEEKAHPVLTFGEPYTQEMSSAWAGNTVVIFPYAFGRVSNSQSTPGRGEKARSAIPRLTYRSVGVDGAVLFGPVNGRWRELPSAIQRAPTQLHTGSITIDLDPNQIDHEFDLAVASKEGILSVDADQANTELGVTETIVDVEVAGSNFPSVSCSFCVRKANGKLAVKKLELAP